MEAMAFAPTTIPQHHRSNGLAQSYPWLTWSPAFRAFAHDLRESGQLRRRVTIGEVPRCKPYGATYRTHLRGLSGTQIKFLTAYAESVQAHDPKTQVIFFRGMLQSALSSRELRVLLSLLREAMIYVAGDEAAALYSPVTPEQRDPGFNLHADLFLTTKLWLIFDDVPGDCTGVSLLLSRKILLKSVRQIPSLPPHVAKEILHLLDRPLKSDSFNRLYGLLHGTGHRWSVDLNEHMKKHVLNIPLRVGEGYLIDDRRWLHGRTAVSRRVSKQRFHRLTFGLRGISAT